MNMSILLNLPNFVELALSPEQLKRMSLSELEGLSAQLRADLISSVSKTGGHLASNLGIVEITLALHRVFDSPKDKLIWDVGHQTYIHKMLTGRKERFDTLRQYKGLAGFVTPVESEHDSFVAGHSSTSISLAVGMAIARDRLGEDHKVVAIIGDGGLTGGMALEALNHLGHIQKDMIIVLNDNEMSISENLGGFSQYMKRIKETFFYKDIKEKLDLIEDELDEVKLEPQIWDLISTVKKQARNRIETPGIVFEKLGINYSGPIDGHDVKAVVSAFERVKDLRGPQLVHVITQKGKGYGPAEADAIKYHGVSAFTPEKVEPAQTTAEPKPKAKTYSQVFTEALIDIARSNENLVAITPATAEGSGLVQFGKEYPDRFFDVAICEQHAVTMAAGLAKAGLLPVVSIYSTFLQRAVDQVIHDVAILNLPVVFGIDRGGLVEDGETHQGVFDISYMRAIPNMRVFAPRNAKELRNILYTLSVEPIGPAAVRFPRDKAIDANGDMPFEKIDLTKWEWLSPESCASAETQFSDKRPVLLAYGAMVEVALNCKAELMGSGIDPVIINARSCKPMDLDCLNFVLKNASKVITLEEGALNGGFGSSVLEQSMALRVGQPKIKLAEIACLGIADNFVEHGARNILLQNCGLSKERVIEFVRSFVS
ncbi:MAG: 1-deoxy-D-xylulose-5-phosphate synthase [Candidatus Obscuribacterales bacterium]|jgi:1-deoxy-D-xylulose-5-phosphate synthase|nr:1-deoxy-D-xylulose-5-phosphate synthase [Candidatus Obscuribacterales bacterium]